MAAQTRAGNPLAKVAKGMMRYGGHVLREKFVRGHATSTADIPIQASQVTGEWLTAALCDEHPEAEIESYQVETVSSATTNRWRATITYNEAGRVAGLPAAVFAKTSQSFAQRLIMGLADLLEGEPGFYKHIRPHIDIEAPHGYHGAADQRSGRSISLMEDIVTTKGVTFCTPRTPISRAQMEGLLTSMATWHGQLWNSSELDRHDWLRKTPSILVSNLSRFAGLKKRAEVGVTRARSALPDGILPIHADLYQALAPAMELASQGPLTFLHGDSHVGNLYLTSSGQGGFSDWQVVMRGNWAFDMSYLVSTSLTVQDRRDWERELLEFYLERLREAGGDAPDFDTAWLTYRQQMIYPYFVWMLVIGRSVIQPKSHSEETSLAIIERVANAVLDLDTLGAVRSSLN